MNGIEQTPEGWWIVSNDSHVSYWVKESKRLDHDQWMLQKLAPYLHPGDCVLDIGANIGDHTIAYIDLVGGEGDVIAFEPSLILFECLKRNLSGRPNGTLIQAAVYNRNGFLQIRQDNENFGMTYVKENKEKADTPCITIDSLCLEKLNFMKIDVEGSEPFVLDGSKDTIEKFHPVICMEINESALKRYHHTSKSLLKMLEDLGYKYETLQDEKIRPLEPGEQFDVLAQWKPE